MSIFNKKNYLAAVSGGPDSIALLHMYKKHIKVVCTVKYNKRIDCTYDVECVEKMCSKYRIPLEILDVTEDIYTKYEFDSNFQSQARRIRYDFFVEIAKKYNIQKILIAHHLDDFLETSYSQFQSNSKNLFYGIKERSKYKDLEIYRPFINRFRKTTLQRYCKDFNLDYAIDSTNTDTKYERNKIRQIISNMDRDSLYNFLKRVKNYNSNNKKKIKKINNQFQQWESSNFEVKLFKTFNQDEQYYLVYNFLQKFEIYRPNKNKINGIIEFIIGMNGKEYRIDNGFKIVKVNGLLKIIN